MTDIILVHGKPSTYTRFGCRCVECKVAKSIAAKKYRDPIKESARVRKWNEDNPGRNSLRMKTWDKANPNNKKLRNARHRARKVEASLGPIDLEALWTGCCGICHLTLDRSLKHPDLMSATVDHIQSLAKGGTHSQDNLQWAHMVCNSKKGASQ